MVREALKPSSSHDLRVKSHAAKNGWTQRAVAVMSLGGPRAASLNDASEDLIASGIKLVVAAGNNNGGDACSYSPASAPNAIAVGASTSSDTIASYSNKGACLFMFAPGSSIPSAGMSGDYAEVTMSGTSMAAPHVAGTVALILQMQPGISNADTKAALDRAAPRITFDSASPSRLVNAQSLRLRPPSPSTTPTTQEPAPTTPTPAPAPAPTSGFSPIQVRTCVEGLSTLNHSLSF